MSILNKIQFNQNLKGMLFALTAFFGYTVMDGTAKYVMTFEHIPWQYLMFYVACCVLACLFAILLITKASFKPRRPFWLLCRASIGVASINTIYYILPKLNLDLFYSLIFVAPIIGSILAVFFLNEHFNLAKAIGLLVGFSGILVISRPWLYFCDHNYHFSWFQLTPLLVALGDALIGLTVRKYLGKDNPFTLVFYQFILCTIVSATCAKITYGHFPPFPSFHLCKELVILTIFTMCGYLFYSRAAQIAPLQLVMPLAYSQMVFGIVLSLFLFHTYPNIYTIMGAIIIIIASLHLTFYTSTHSKDG